MKIKQWGASSTFKTHNDTPALKKHVCTYNVHIYIYTRLNAYIYIYIDLYIDIHMDI